MLPWLWLLFAEESGNSQVALSNQGSSTLHVALQWERILPLHNEREKGLALWGGKFHMPSQLAMPSVNLCYVETPLCHVRKTACAARQERHSISHQQVDTNDTVGIS